MAQESARPWVLKLNECPEGTRYFEFEADAGELDLSAESFSFPGPLRVGLTVVRTLETFHLEGEIECPVEGACCRCLESAKENVEASMRLLLQCKAASEEELEALAEEEIEILRPGTDTFDMREALREEILLELPMQIHCQHDCKGLCPQCGQNLNVGSCSCKEEESDPRWAALGELKFS